MEIQFRPRRVGMTTYQIEGMHFNMLQGKNVFMAMMGKTVIDIERHIIDLFIKGHTFNVKECHTSRLEVIYDNDRFEPAIIGYKTINKFTGYYFELL